MRSFAIIKSSRKFPNLQYMNEIVLYSTHYGPKLLGRKIPLGINRYWSSRHSNTMLWRITVLPCRDLAFKNSLLCFDISNTDGPKLL